MKLTFYTALFLIFALYACDSDDEIGNVALSESALTGVWIETANLVDGEEDERRSNCYNENIARIEIDSDGFTMYRINLGATDCQQEGGARPLPWSLTDNEITTTQTAFGQEIRQTYRVINFEGNNMQLEFRDSPSDYLLTYRKR
ncbi:MAG: hypothetical protein LAT68_03180 [Cyclobacteriaceae bacterium]|nr:hypothetical protein [Cyclobacteriaceae bacterium]MCH8515310.1 hypothetical protein [Cyclobacteriaceae bacterium]